jgi:hypothetical protein
MLSGWIEFSIDLDRFSCAVGFAAVKTKILRSSDVVDNLILRVLGSFSFDQIYRVFLFVDLELGLGSFYGVYPQLIR